jgi:hypothetical protein
MTKTFLTAVALTAICAATTFLVGCGKQDPTATARLDTRVSFSTLESNRATAAANALKNAQVYRADNPRFDTHQIITHTDSTIANDCPQGDGWATVSIMKVGPETDAKGKPIVEKFSVKCSTVSQALGCYLDSDFAKKKEISGDDGSCQPTDKVPFPLPAFK